MSENLNQTWFKKHIDTVIILGAFASSILWMNGKFNEIEKEISVIKSVFEKDIAVIKAVMLMKQILPPELAKKEEK